MIVLAIRRGVVYAATGVFFAVAAIAQVQGAATADAFLKAGVACLVLIGIGVMILRIVDDAARKAADSGSGAEKADEAEPRAAAAIQTGEG